MTTAGRWLTLLGGVQRSPVVTLLRLLPALGWMAGIFYLSQQARPLGGTVGTPVDSLGHFVEYAILLGALWLASDGIGWSRDRPTTSLLAVTAASIVYAGSDELHQALVDGRSSSAKDFGVDVLGVAAGTALIGFHLAARGLRHAILASPPRAIKVK